MEKDKIKKLAGLLGKYVVIDETKVPEVPGRTPHIRQTKQWISQIVGISKINCANNGIGISNGEVIIYPDYKGRNWHHTDLRMIVDSSEDAEDLRSRNPEAIFFRTKFD